MNKIVGTILILFIALSCKRSNEQTIDIDDEKYKIMAFLIEKIPPGPPPPPPPHGVYEIDTLKMKRYMDSIYLLDVNIGIIKEVSDFRAEYNKRKLKDSLYQKLLNHYHNSDHIPFSVEKNRINVKKNRKLRVFSNDSAGKYLRTVEHVIDPKVKCIVNFSDITFNEVNNKAIIYMSRYYHPLNGGTSLFLLEKIDNKWRIYKTITLSIS